MKHAQFRNSSGRRRICTVVIGVTFAGAFAAAGPSHRAYAQATRPAAGASQPTSRPATQPAAKPVLEELKEEAAALKPLVRAPLVQRFLAATADLPSVTPRTAFYNREKRDALSPADAAGLSEEARTGYKEVQLDESFYYTTRYGTPLAYSRPLDLLAEAGFDDVRGRRLLDFGYGSIGHLRLLASLGAEVVGVEVDPLLPILYGQPGDQGAVRGRDGAEGSVRLVNGHWPGDDAVRKAVGGGYDLIISKNTLKRGYLHPARPTDERRLVKLGVEDEAFVRAVYDALRPGGRFMIFNICPAQAPPDKDYIPWADGQSPFSRELFEKTGFRVVAFDVDDTPATRRMAKALGWDDGPGGMNLENDLFCWYTLVERPK